MVNKLKYGIEQGLVSEKILSLASLWLGVYTNMIILGISPKKEAERERRVSVNKTDMVC